MEVAHFPTGHLLGSSECLWLSQELDTVTLSCVISQVGSSLSCNLPRCCQTYKVSTCWMIIQVNHYIRYQLTWWSGELVWRHIAWRYSSSYLCSWMCSKSALTVSTLKPPWGSQNQNLRSSHQYKHTSPSWSLISYFSCCRLTLFLAKLQTFSKCYQKVG